MRTLALLVPLMIGSTFQEAGAITEQELVQRFTNLVITPDGKKHDEERWLLGITMLDQQKKAAFEADGNKVIAGQEDATNFEMRWRKKIAEEGRIYKDYLETNDIISGAPSVEAMVKPYEIARMKIWVSYQNKEKQQESAKNLADGNDALRYPGGRWLVEPKVRAKRQSVARDIGNYLTSPKVTAALNYQETAPTLVASNTPAPAPSPTPTPSPSAPPRQSSALEQLENAAATGQSAANAATDETATSDSDQSFSGGAGSAGASPVVSAPMKADLAGAPKTGGGGFRFQAPPTPDIDPSKPQGSKDDPFASILGKILPLAAGGLVGAVAGAVLMGAAIMPILGAIAGAVLGLFVAAKLFM